MEPPAQQSPRYWKSLEQYEDTPEFRQSLVDEFTGLDDAAPANPTRRTFLKTLAASAVVAGLSGCKPKITEQIVPYVRQPAGAIPGRPLFYATTMTLSGYAHGVLATSREGRPIKLEGNPDHPATLGSSDVFLQAAIYDLYDPDRSPIIKRAGIPTDWDSFIGALRPRLQSNPKIALLTETITSPTLLSQIAALKSKYPETRWYVHDPLSRQNIQGGLRTATGREIVPIYDFSKADVILSLDCDFLGEEPGHIRYARDFIDRRRIRVGTNSMNRLYVIESTHSITGTQADHRWAMRPSQIAAAAQAISAAFQNPASAPDWARAIAADLQNAPGKSLIIAGPNQPPAVHALVHSLNAALGNIGSAVNYIPPPHGDPDGDLAALTAELNRNNFDTLIILGGNPSYTAPIDLHFADALESFSKQTDRNLTLRLGLFEDETSFNCQWHLPQTHFLEEWSDARAYDGSISMAQPLIAPLYEGRSPIELLDLLLTGTLRDGYEITRDSWSHQHARPDFETLWQRSIEKGIWLGNFTPIPPSPNAHGASVGSSPTPTGYEISFRPDPCIWDGSFTNNAFLQETPKPLTKLTWDNAALISPTTARDLGAANGDILQITTAGQTLEIPAWILPGQPDGAVTLHLGYGRTRGGKTAVGTGFNAYKLRTTQNPWFATADIIRTGATYPLVATHTHQTIADRQLYDLQAQTIQRPGEENIDNRKLVRVATLSQYIDDPHFVEKLDEDETKHHLTLYPGYENIYQQNLRWGMSIDMQSCIGCNACVMACQTENNSPVVGKDQVARGREMHWIRIDTYFQGTPESPSATFHQPVPCQQCENAPCELVCPVGATVHDNEGLNNMVYNRCVGTRYCSNNCPYKVRRFNFLQFSDTETESLKLMRNPEVTVRSRGVMEKCTYCIQRITATRLDMEITQVQMDAQARAAADPAAASAIQQQSAQQRQKLLDNLQTACQQACPTRAIIFGNLNAAVDPIHDYDRDHLSEVAQLKKLPLDYSLLADLTTQPRTTYLARIQNPNPALAKEDT